MLRYLSKTLICVLLAFSVLPAQAETTAAEELKQQYKPVLIDKLIAGSRKETDPRRYMIQPYGVQFTAQLQTTPKPGTFKLVYEALNFWDIQPLPEVDYSAFVRTPEGEVISVYIENQTAQRMLEHLKPGAPTTFFALHIYNYSQGPRLLLMSFGE